MNRQLGSYLPAAIVVGHHMDTMSPRNHRLSEALDSEWRAPRCREWAGGNHRNVQRRQVITLGPAMMTSGCGNSGVAEYSNADSREVKLLCAGGFLTPPGPARDSPSGCRNNSN